MNVKIEFSTDINTQFADAIQDTKLFSTLLINVINNPSPEKYDFSLTIKDWTDVPRRYNPRNKHHTLTWDLGKWIDDTIIYGDPFKQIDYEDFCSSNVILLGKGQEEVIAAQRPEYKLFTKLMANSLKKKIKSIVMDNFRSFEDICNGKQAYNETLFYEVIRYKMAGMAGWFYEKSLYFPNSSEIDVLKYFDTQVEYNTSYRYVIVAHQLVVGNKYEYQEKEIIDLPDNKRAKLCLFNEPSIKLLPMTYYDSVDDYPEGIIILDKPPVPPNVNVVPYKGVGDKILIWLNGNVGDYWQDDIRILPDELDERDEAKKNKEGEIHFKSDDPVSKFEIFRIENRPRTFRDFAEMKTPFMVTTKGASSAAFTDEIKPNKKYYYTFRSIDSHGHTSNPSPVYEVELVKNDENVFALINIIDMGLPPVMQITKPGKRFLEIKPSLFQTVLDKELLVGAEQNRAFKESNMDKYAKFLAEQSIWGSGLDKQKQYKVRLSSRLSGKKFDINLKFKFQVSGSI